MSDIIIVGKDCEGCKHCKKEDKFYIRCAVTDKKYMYGSKKPCNDYEVEDETK